MKNKKQLVFSWIAIFTFVLFIVGATYAYFQNQGGDSSSVDVSVSTNTVDTLTFEVGDPISLTASQFDFTKNGNDKVGSTFAKAILSANNKTNSATKFYYLYLVIEENDFIYTQGSDYPELILNIEKNDGSEISYIYGLYYFDTEDIKGFDVTNKKGVYKIVYNYPISTTSTTTDEWNVKLTFVNYDKDQSKNAGHTFSVKLLISSSNLPDSIDDVCNNGDNINDCLIKLNNESGPYLSNLFYHNGSILDGRGIVLDAEDKSYRYAGEDICMYKDYQVFSTGGSNACKNAYNIPDGTEIFDDTIMLNPTNVKWDSTNNKCVTINGDDVYLVRGGNISEDTCTGTAYYVTLGGGYFLGIEKVTDGIPYKSSSVNNYICFGSTDNNCPEDNLYRIIGSFKGDNNNYNLKLIKATPATKKMLGDKNADYNYLEYISQLNLYLPFYKGSYDLSNVPIYNWNSTSGEIWANGELNNINLNTNFISYLDSLNTANIIWKDKIIVTDYYAYGNLSIYDVLTYYNKNIYQNEINPDRKISSNKKIGLMYVSDFGYASSFYFWQDVLDFNIVNLNNWIFNGLIELTITPYIDDNGNAGLFSTRNIFYSGVYNYGIVRPVFYLQSGVNYVSGKGTSDDPIRVSFD